MESIAASEALSPLSRTFAFATIVTITVLNAVILAPLPFGVRAVAAFVLCVPVVGYLLTAALRLEGCVGLAEQLLFAMGAGYAATVLLTLALSYLPGGLQRWQTLAALDGLVAILFVVALLAGREGTASAADSGMKPAAGEGPQENTWLWLGIASIVLTAFLLRVPNLAYSEFQDDEVSVVWHSAELIQGRADALYVHDKGPAEILLTTAVYSLADRMNEATARLPFTVANVTALLALFWLGWRFFGPVAGWTAAMLLAVDGYFIGFSRIVQYQSIVFLMVVLVAGICYLYVEKPRTPPSLMYLGALFFSTGVLAHYEAAIVLIPGAFLFVMSIRDPDSTLRRIRHSALPALLALSILLLFYVPFSQHPRFARTFTEITGNRIGSGFPYNNLSDFFTRTIIYSSTYYFAFVTLAVMAALIYVYWRTLPRVLFWVASVALVGALAGFFVRPEWLTVGGTDFAWVAFALALAPPILGRGVGIPERATWLWFGAALILSLFFIQKPRTHVYDFFIPMSLIVGAVCGLAWRGLEQRLGRRAATAVAVPVATLLTLLFANYGYWMFVHNQVEVLRTWEQNRPAGYWTPMKEARQNAIFGFPFKNGWKVVGALYADGVLDAPFARNGKRGVSNWYTRAAHECPRDARYYVFTPWNEPTNKGLTAAPHRPSQDEGYELIHVVTVNGEPRLEIFERGAAPVANAPVHAVEEYEARFDATLSGPIFEEPGPAGWTAMEHPLGFRFGDDIVLLGYSLGNKEVAPGERVELTLYWQATQTPGASYKVFTQVIDPVSNHKAGQRDGVPGCERFPTNQWLPGEPIVDRYSIDIVEDAPAGDYSLLIGLYDAGEERLEVFAPDGSHVGDALGIDTITVVE